MFFLTELRDEAAAGPIPSARQKRGSQLDSICTQSQRGDYPSRVSDSARGDYRHIDHVYNLRDQRERARQ